MSRIIPLVVMVWAFCAELCSGAIVPVIAGVYNYGYAGMTNTYTVPADKILMIRQITVVFTNDNMSAGISIWRADDVYEGKVILGKVQQTTTYNPPIVIPGDKKLVADGATIEMPSNYVIFGYLVDASDLYASIPNDFESIKLAGSETQMGIRLDSPQPAKITVEESDNLLAWTPREDMQASASSDRSLYSVTDSLLDPRLFYRAKARAIR